MFAKTAAATLLLVSAAAVGAVPDYQVVEIYGGAGGSNANAVSDNGIVVGCYRPADNLDTSIAIKWQAGHRTDLGPGCATAVGPTGLVGGYDGNNNGILWKPSGETVSLGASVGVVGINRQEVVLLTHGEWTNNNTTYTSYSYLWQNGQATMLPSDCGSRLNDQNQVLCQHGIWKDGVITPFPTYRGAELQATALSQAGDVFGTLTFYDDTGYLQRQWTWYHGATNVLEPIGGRTQFETAKDMNDMPAFLADGEGEFGFVFGAINGSISTTDYPKMVPTKINASGWITAQAQTGPNSGNFPVGVVLIPKAAPGLPGTPVAGLPVMSRPVQDFNADVRGDLLWHSNGGAWGAWLMDGKSPIGGGNIAVPTNSSLVARGDFNGDSRGDLVFKDGSGAYWITLMNGTDATSTKVYDGAGGWSLVGVGDFNGDHFSDLLWYHPQQGFAVWLMNGTTVTGGGAIPYPGNAWPAAIGELTGDGRDDILWMGSDGHFEVYAMNGTSAAALGTIREAGTGFKPAFVADFDGDGRQDIVWTHPDGRASLWLIDGATIKNSTTILDAGSAWHVIGTPDLDGSATADLLFRNDDGSVGAWLMSGVTPIDGRILLGANTGWSVAQDIEVGGDFKTDLVWRNADGSYAVWLMNGLTPTDGATILPGGSGWELAAK